MIELKFSKDNSKSSNSTIVINCINTESIFCIGKNFFNKLAEDKNQAKVIRSKLFMECVKSTKWLTEVKFLKYKL